MHLHLVFPDNVLGMAGRNPVPQLPETLSDERSVIIEPPRAVYHVTDVQMDSERFAVHSQNQLHIALWAVRQVPPGGLDGKLGPFRLDRIDDPPTVLYGSIEIFLGHILRMRSIPHRR